MSVHNAEIAEWLNQYALLLEIEDANPFRVRAYRNAAREVGNLPDSIENMLTDGADLSELPAIGKDLAHKIEVMVHNGYFPELNELEKTVPAELLELAVIPGLGPKRVKTLYKELGIHDTKSLAKAAKTGKISHIAGFGVKTEARILSEIEKHHEKKERFLLRDAEEIAERFLQYLKETPGVKQAIIAGSYRRRKDTVGDIDILATCADSAKAVRRFVHYEEVEDIISQGTTRSTVRLHSGIQVDLRVVADASYGAALQYFTGSKAHNIALRKISLKQGMKINEYGVFKGNKKIAGRTEEEIYNLFGITYIEPELRENRGEVEAALEHKLPKLVSIKDLRGDLHAHTNATDGQNTLEEMAKAAAQKGYEYLAITDHTKHVTVAHGLDAKKTLEHIKQIDRLNEKLKDIRLLKSAEIDILADGSLDLPNSVLKELDLAVCAVHYKFDMSETEQTERIIRAMDNPYFNILAHPTGRLLGTRDAYLVDMERLMMAAMERGCYMEVNSQPQRMDLNDSYCRMAKKIGLKLAISTDAHSARSLDYIRYGVGQARRGWLEAEDVINTKKLTDLLSALKR